MTHLSPAQVFESLDRSILRDGFDIVMDLEKSQGARIYDAKANRKIVDFFSFFASNPIGFNHPRMSDGDFEKDLLRAAKVKVSNSDVYTAEYAEFVEFFHKNFVSDFDRLFFIEGGALGVENCLKAAQDWKVRKNIEKGLKNEIGGQILHFKQAFHGRTGYTLSLTNTVPDKTAYFPKFDWPRVVNPKLQFPITAENLASTKQLEKQSIEQIQAAFKNRPDEICAILIEPIQGEGGDNFFRKEFLQELKKTCLENEALLIFDEVQTGMGITGKMWAHEHFDVSPDLMAFGKKVQVCGCAAHLDRLNDVENVFKKSSRINSTWGGNLTDMVRSHQFMKIILEENLLENVNRQGESILSELQDLSNKDSRVSNVRGLGLWIAFDLPDPEIRDKFFKQCMKNGLMILTCGEKSMRLRPVLNLQSDEAEEGLGLIRKSLQEI